MFRRSRMVLLAIAALTLLAAPALAQQQGMQGAMDDGMYVTVSQPSFSWTGKQDQQANYSWSATVDNPYERPANVRVTLELLDDGGNVVGTDSETLEVPKRSQADVSSEGTLAYSAASQAAQYRITVAGVEEMD